MNAGDRLASHLRSCTRCREVNNGIVQLASETPGTPSDAQLTALRRLRKMMCEDGRAMFSLAMRANEQRPS